MLFGKTKSKSSVKKVIENVISLIENTNISTGDKIPSEKQLMKKFEVSRSTIREALSALVTIGVLESRPGKGYYVRRSYQLSIYTSELITELINEDSFFDLMESRKIVEKSIFQLAAQRATKKDIKVIESALDKLKKAVEENKENINNLTTEVHFAIGQAAHNEILVGLLKQLSPMIVRKVKQLDITSHENYKLHKELVVGIKSGKSEKAENTILEHLEYMEDKYINSLTEDNNIIN